MIITQLIYILNLHLFYFLFVRLEAVTDIVIIGGSGSPGTLDDVETILVMDDEGVKESPCQIKKYPMKIDWHAGVISNNQPVVCGGTYKQGTTAKCNKYNFETKEWTDMPSMNTERGRHAMTEANGDLFITGGIDRNGKRLDTAEMFKDGTWSMIKNLPKVIYGHCLVKMNDESIINIGGYDGSKVSKR